MIDNLKPYPEYRNAEGGWLGQIPSHWKVRRLKYVLREHDVRSLSGKEQLLRVSQYTGVTKRLSLDGTDGPDTRAASLVGYKRVEPNHLVINIMLAWNGSMGVSRFEGIASPAYCVYRFEESAYPWFFHELLRSPVYKARIKAMSTGVVESRLRLYSDDLFRIEAILPPPDEQASIVRFLGHLNRRVDQAIRSKRKLIALLNEQKQAIIHKAVTRGLDPNVPLKDSGIPWLGQIPTHWERTSLKRMFSRVDYGTSEISKPDAGIRILTMANIQKGEITPPRSLGVNSIQKELLLQKHDLLFTRTNGNPNLVGKVGIFRGDISDRISFASYLVRFRTNHLADAEWMNALLNSSAFWAFARSHALVNLQTNLNSSRYVQFQIPFPAREEQEKIIAHIKRNLLPINAEINKLEEASKLLREYRTRLVSDVVTGKLDVREAAAKLPPEEEESDSVVESEDLDELDDEAVEEAA